MTDKVAVDAAFEAAVKEETRIERDRVRWLLTLAEEDGARIVTLERQVRKARRDAWTWMILSNVIATLSILVFFTRNAERMIQ